MSTASIAPDIRDLLDRFGPERADQTVSLAEAQRHCRGMATGHYENFPVLSLAVPGNLRQDMANVYAFCRWADDLGDEIDSPQESMALLEWWQRELDACFQGEAWHPVFVALRETVRIRHLSQQPFNDLLSAFRQDQSKRSYETFAELQDYCRRSADPVGRIVLRLCGRDSAENIARSDAVCTGLQLINFWQDVARDFDRGRVYLPAEDRRRFGYTDDDLQSRRTTPAFQKLMAFEVDRARNLLREGQPLADGMPGRLKIVIAMFALGGLRLCDHLAAMDYRVWDRRPTVGGGDAARILGLATTRAVQSYFRRTQR